MKARARVGLNVQALRRAKGLTQEDLSARAEIHQTYLSGVERGKRNPSLDVLERLAVALGTDLEEVTRKRPGRRESKGAISR